MARQRRGGFRPEIRGTLGTLLRTTLEQASVVRDAITGTARTRLDEARSHRKRNEALAELGEIVLDLVRRGEIDLEELPEARTVIRQLEALDSVDDQERDSATTTSPPIRRRFDDRGGSDRHEGDDGTVGSTWRPPHRAGKPTSVWRPPAEDAPNAAVPAPKSPAARLGGISFEDEDLADYMHPDDVPPKDPKDGDA